MGGFETSMAFDGVPIGISDGLPKNRRFWRGLFPGLGALPVTPRNSGGLRDDLGGSTRKIATR